MNDILFDRPFYIEINEARWIMAKGILGQLPGIKTCLDVGCGPGWFSARLLKMGYGVVGIDGRDELVEEAIRRVPEARFKVVDITLNTAYAAVSPTDLVFCFGLLYHLENPFAAIRQLHALSNKYLFIETQIAPGDAANLVLVSEGKNETQGLNFHAIIPSRRALLKMLYVSGFHSVFRYFGTVDHIDFVDGPQRIHRREIFLATKAESICLPEFVLEAEPVTPKIDYTR
jgi:SAM-dependent methyltransferase